MKKHLIAMLVASIAPSFMSEAFAVPQGGPFIAKWYGNKAAAVSLRFDDSLDSHVTYVIPKLNEYGIKATFMINPGLDRYKRNQTFWEQRVPEMGHELGNHTMNHRGAKTPEEADFEIGEASRLIWKLYPQRSRLTPFASGGGGLAWGGRDWKTASEEYKRLPKKYFLIDLYDGRHSHLAAGSGNGFEDMVRAIQKTVAVNGHQALAFHKVDNPDVVDWLKSIYRGYDLTFRRESFENLVEFLKENEKEVWIAPVGDILKYETERNGARLETLSRNASQVRLGLHVDTDEKLYDHDLTLVVPIEGHHHVVSILQRNQRIERYTVEDNRLLVSARPTTSIIEIQFR